MPSLVRCYDFYNTLTKANKMNTPLIAALEELQEQSKIERTQLDNNFNITEDIILTNGLVQEFDHYSDQYDNLVSTAQALEAIYETVQSSEYPDDKTNYEAIVKISSDLVSSLDTEGNIFSSVATEGWSAQADRCEQKKVALESIGSWLERLWAAIKRFLSNIWNWIKNLHIWQVLKIKKLEKIQEDKKELLKDLDKADANFKYDITQAQAANAKAALADRKTEEQILREVIAKSRKRSSAFNSRIVTPEGKSVMDPSTDLPRMPKRKLAKEDFSDTGNGFVESVFSIIDTVRGMELCYNSNLSKYLLTNAQIKDSVSKKRSIALSAVAATLFSTQDFFKSYVAFIGTKYMDALKKSINILTASEFDSKAAQEIVLNLYPSAKDFSGFKVGKIIDNSFVIDDASIVAVQSLKFSFLSEQELEALANSFVTGQPIGRYLNTVIFSKTMPMAQATEANALIEINKRVNKADVQKLLDKQAKEIFTIFSSTSDFANKYQNVINGLNKAVDRVSRQKDEDFNRKAILFARAVLHSTNVYVNQPLVFINSLAPDIIYAITDYVDSFIVCNDPTSVASLI